MKLKNMWIAGIALAIAPAAWSAPFTETSDAGQTLGSAQVLGAGIDRINGSVDAGTADLFQFNWGGGLFSANTLGSNFDTQLFLFNGTGQGIWSNDDIGWINTRSQITDWSLDAGTYHIAISGYNLDPYGASGPIFGDAPWWAPILGAGPVSDDTLAYWAGGAGGGDYRINFLLGETTAAVPEPATLALLGLGLLGLGAGARRRRIK